jgi:hypothetical protein
MFKKEKQLRSQLLFSLPITLGILITVENSNLARAQSLSSEDAKADIASPNIDINPAPSQSQPINAEQGNRPLLQGGVQHSEELPGLDESLKPGMVYKEDALLNPAAPENNDWFLIPPWFAGERHTDDVLVVYRYDFQTDTSSSPMLRQLERQNSISGFQRDSKGNIWDYKHVPTIQHVESFPCDAVLYVKSITPLRVSPEQIVLRYEEVCITLEKRRNKILQVQQQEQINTVTSPQPGLLRIDVSVKNFGWDGKPLRLEQSLIFAKIIKPFEQIDLFEGKDLRPLFKDYLVSHHLENLVPSDLSN